MKVHSFVFFAFFICSTLMANSISEVPLKLIFKKSNLNIWHYEIQSPDVLDLQNRLHLRGIKSDIKKDLLTFDFKQYPNMKIKVPPYSLQPSFLVNFHKEEFKKLENLPSDVLGLRDYVFTYISDKNYSKGVELAHQTLESKSGDCTEHAILLTALLRLKKIPARIVLGFVVIKKINKAYMHAWSEYFDVKDGQFKLLDATKSGEEEMSYVPLYALENESMSYAKDFLKALNLRLQNITIL